MPSSRSKQSGSISRTRKSTSLASSGSGSRPKRSRFSRRMPGTPLPPPPLACGSCGATATGSSRSACPENRITRSPRWRSCQRSSAPSLLGGEAKKQPGRNEARPDFRCRPFSAAASLDDRSVLAPDRAAADLRDPPIWPQPWRRRGHHRSRDHAGTFAERIIAAAILTMRSSADLDRIEVDLDHLRSCSYLNLSKTMDDIQ